MRYVDQIEKTNVLETVTRAAHGSINLPSSSQRRVIERFKYTVERPRIPRHPNLQIERVHGRRLIEEVEDCPATATNRARHQSEQSFHSFRIGANARWSPLPANTSVAKLRPQSTIDSTDYRHLFYRWFLSRSSNGRSGVRAIDSRITTRFTISRIIRIRVNISPIVNRREQIRSLVSSNRGPIEDAGREASVRPPLHSLSPSPSTRPLPTDRRPTWWYAIVVAFFLFFPSFFPERGSFSRGYVTPRTALHNLLQ